MTAWHCVPLCWQTLLMGHCWRALPSWQLTSAEAIPAVIYLLYTNVVRLENQWCCKCGKAPCRCLVWKPVYSPQPKNNIIQSAAHSTHLLLQCSQGCTAKGWSYTIKITFLSHPTVRGLQLFIWEKKPKQQNNSIFLATPLEVSPCT